MVTWDLFAGAGGSSEGARQAGARVVWAANHWPLAVEVHELNHPETAHACQDLTQADFRALVRGARRRMLTGREYARAMGFPDSYKLTGFVSKDCRLLGNAVPPPVMRSIVTEVMRRG